MTDRRDEATEEHDDSDVVVLEENEDEDEQVYGVPELDDSDDLDAQEDFEDEGEMTPSEILARLLNVGIGLVVAVLVTLLAVVVPNAETEPRGVPVGVVGNEETVEMVTSQLEQVFPEGYDVRTYDDADALRDATRAREVYGGWVLSDDAQPESFVASAADADQAELIQQMLPVEPTDVAATTSQDPGALGVTVSAVLVALVALGLAVALRDQLPGRLRAQAGGAVALSVALGLALSAVLHGLGAVTGSFWTTAGAAALGTLASTMVAIGLVNLAGLAGGAIVLFLITVPGIGLAGLWQLPESLPAPWGAVGQMLPTGAVGRLLGSTAYFGGAGALRPGIVLLAWLILGVGLVLLAALVARRAAARAAQLAAADAAVAELEDEESGDEEVADEERLDDDIPDEDADEPEDVETVGEGSSDGAEMPGEGSGDTVEDMSDTEDTDPTGQEPQPGRADWLRKGGAEAERRPEQTSGTGVPLEDPSEIQGEEGGGDPAAGAQQDATGSGGEDPTTGPDGGHRSGREGGL